MRIQHTLAGKRALVTGGRGFIGSHLIEKLVNLGAEVHATSRIRPESNSTIQWWKTDLANLEEGLTHTIEWFMTRHKSKSPKYDTTKTN